MYFMNMKKLFALMLAASMTLSMVACSSSSESTTETTTTTTTETTTETEVEGETEMVVPVQQLAIGTAASGGAFYPIGVGIAEVITGNVSELTVTAEITGGSTENVRLVGEGDLDFAISNANDAYFGYSATETYAGSDYSLSAISSLHSSFLQIVTIGSTGITSVADLAGQKVAVGPVGGGAILPFTTLLASYGIDFDTQINASYVSYDDGIEQLKDGQVVACIVMSALGSSSVLSLAATDTVVLVEADAANIAEVTAIYPFYTNGVCEASVYGTATDINLIEVANIVYCNNDLSTETVYAITKAMVENLDDMKSYHSSLEPMTLETMVLTSGIPLHPGAELYYSEAGMI